MLPRFPAACLVVVAALLAALPTLTGCGADDWSEPHATPTAVGVLGAGFVPTATPAPESTVAPSPGSWDGVRPPKGYRVVLLSAGTDAPIRTLVEAVRSWAKKSDVSLKRVVADDARTYLETIDKAIALGPDLVVSVGNDLVDPLSTVTAHHLAQKFLVVGAELAEPTGNVTAADWTGAAFRGEGLGMSSAYDASTFTAERAGRAVRAGVAAVLTGHTGIVLWLD